MGANTINTNSTSSSFVKLDRPVFIVGCQRSGSTLLRELVTKHPRLSVMYETHLLPLFWSYRKQMADMGTPKIIDIMKRNLPHANARWRVKEHREDLDRLCEEILGSDAIIDSPQALLGASLSAWATISDKPRVGEKTPAHLYFAQQILEYQPSAKILIIRRDPRASAHSESGKLAKDSTGFRRYDTLRFAVRWATSVAMEHAIANRYGKDHVHVVAYENLVGNPEPTVMKICRFIEEPFDARMLDVDTVNSSFTQSRLSADAPHTSAQGFSKERLTRWQRDMNPVEGAVLEHLVADYMALTGYEPFFEPLTGLHRARVSAQRMLVATAVAACRQSPAAFYAGLRRKHV